MVQVVKNSLGEAFADSAKIVVDAIRDKEAIEREDDLLDRQLAMEDLKTDFAMNTDSFDRVTSLLPADTHISAAPEAVQDLTRFMLKDSEADFTQPEWANVYINPVSENTRWDELRAKAASEFYQSASPAERVALGRDVAFNDMFGTTAAEYEMNEANANMTTEVVAGIRADPTLYEAYMEQAAGWVPITVQGPNGPVDISQAQASYELGFARLSMARQQYNIDATSENRKALTEFYKDTAKTFADATGRTMSGATLERLMNITTADYEKLSADDQAVVDQVITFDRRGAQQAGTFLNGFLNVVQGGPAMAVQLEIAAQAAALSTDPAVRASLTAQISENFARRAELGGFQSWVQPIGLGVQVKMMNARRDKVDVPQFGALTPSIASIHFPPQRRSFGYAGDPTSDAGREPPGTPTHYDIDPSLRASAPPEEIAASASRFGQGSSGTDARVGQAALNNSLFPGVRRLGPDEINPPTSPAPDSLFPNFAVDTGDSPQYINREPVEYTPLPRSAPSSRTFPLSSPAPDSALQPRSLLQPFPGSTAGAPPGPVTDFIRPQAGAGLSGNAGRFNQFDPDGKILRAATAGARGANIDKVVKNFGLTAAEANAAKELMTLLLEKKAEGGGR